MAEAKGMGDLLLKWGVMEGKMSLWIANLWTDSKQVSLKDSARIDTTIFLQFVNINRCQLIEFGDPFDDTPRTQPPQ